MLISFQVCLQEGPSVINLFLAQALMPRYVGIWVTPLFFWFTIFSRLLHRTLVKHIVFLKGQTTNIGSGSKCQFSGVVAASFRDGSGKWRSTVVQDPRCWVVSGLLTGSAFQEISPPSKLTWRLLENLPNFIIGDIYIFIHSCFSIVMLVFGSMPPQKNKGLVTITGAFTLNLPSFSGLLEEHHFWTMANTWRTITTLIFGWWL